MKKLYVCFNTLYVVGSSADDKGVNEITTFQYIICRWFKFKLFLLNLVPSFGFNTLYVVGSN